MAIVSDDSNGDARIAFEREKWADEVRLREREIEARAIEAAARAREQQNHADQIRFNQEEAHRGRWRNPLVVAVFAAAIAAAGNALVALLNGWGQRDLEERKSIGQIRVEQIKADQALILEVIKTNSDPDRAAANITFLVKTALIADRQRREELQRFLATRKPGEGPALPSVVTSPAINIDHGCRSEVLAEVVAQTIQTSEVDLYVESCVSRRGGFFAYFHRIENRGSNEVIRVRWSPFIISDTLAPGKSLSVHRLDFAPPTIIDTMILYGANQSANIKAYIPNKSGRSE